MLNCRIIPVLTIAGENLVKTKKFKNARYVGDPINAIKIFNDKEVDELIILDIAATKNNLEPNFELIREMVSECFMPICYGGGIKTIEQAKKIFDLGIEKICLNQAVMKDPYIVSKLSTIYGSQSICVSVDLKRSFLGQLKLYDYNKKKLISRDWIEYLRSIESMGAGEIILNCTNNDGMKNGFEYDAVKNASENLTIPLTALGGAGEKEHFIEAFKCGASALAASSFFIYYGPYDAVLIRYPKL